MSLGHRQQRQLRRIQTDLRGADPRLSGMFGVFGRLYPDQDMPAWEQQIGPPNCQARLWRAAARIVALPAAVIPAISVLARHCRHHGHGETPRRVQAQGAKRERTRPRPEGSA